MREKYTAIPRNLFRQISVFFIEEITNRLLYSLLSEVEGSKLPDWRLSFKKFLLRDGWQTMIENYSIFTSFLSHH